MSDPYLPLYVGDYLKDTGYLTLEQHGAYLMLLMRLWSAGGKLPDDEVKLSRLAGVSVKKWRPIWSDLRDFFEVENGIISHGRINAELEKARGLRAKRAAAGAIGGSAKALKNNEAPVANAVAGLKQIIPDHKEVKIEAKASTKKAVRLGSDFAPDMEFATGLGLPLSKAKSEFEKFRDYWAGKAGKDGAKLDWQATWRNWIRNAVERTQTSTPVPQQIDWQKRLDYYADKGTWAPAWGPKPGEVGCKAPLNGKYTTTTSKHLNMATTSGLNG